MQPEAANRQAAQAHQQAQQLILAGQFADAGPCLRQAVALAPLVSEYRFNLAVWLSDTAPSAAIDAYRELLKQEPTHTDAALNLAVLLIESGQSKAAIDALTALPLALVADNAELSNTLGSALLSEQAYGQAIACFEQALGVNANAADIRQNLTIAHQLRLRQIETLAASLAAKPDDYLSLAKLGWLKVDAGEQEEAASLFAKARASHDAPVIRQGLAACTGGLEEKIVGQRISFLPVAPEHADFITRLFNNRDFMRRIGRRWQLPTDLDAYLANASQTPANLRTTLEWVIAEQASATPLGMLIMTDIDWQSSRAELAIGFPLPAQTLSPLALEAMLLTLDLAFNRACLRKAVACVYEDNANVQQTLISLGFTQEGFFRDQIYDNQDERWVSLFINGLLEANFRADRRLSRLSLKLLGHDITATHA